MTTRWPPIIKKQINSPAGKLDQVPNNSEEKIADLEIKYDR